ncbi:MAG: HNH endonuclease [Clostridium butyricum]|nr:HNH endonuclease [Clostridium butyricum]
MKENYVCELCNRNVSIITKHHLIPKQKGGKNYKTIHLCTTCHKQIHALFTNRELATLYNSIDSLKNNDKIIKFLNFIKKFPNDYHINIKKSRHVRKSG